MATTYTLISSTTLGSNQTTVTFSSISSTYTDLVIRASLRATGSGIVRNIIVTFNSDTANNYSDTQMQGTGSAAASQRNFNQGNLIIASSLTAAGATANTFSNFEMYIPNYLVSTNKPISSNSASENNATSAYIIADAGLWRNTSAISSITFSPTTSVGGDFVSGSSFYLYGIKNS